MNGKTEPSSTEDILGIDIDTYRKWIEYQLTPEMNWKDIDIDHARHTPSIDISNDRELKESFNWKNTQPPLKQIGHKKGTKSNFSDYRLTFVKAYHFIKLNE